MEDLLRECMFQVATGEMGSGKTYYTHLTILAYVKQHPDRMAIIFDPNDEEIWHSYNSVYFNILEVISAKKRREKGENVPMTKSEQAIQKLTLLAGKPYAQRIRRIVPRLPDGRRMEIHHMRDTMISIFENFRRGLVFDDDINKYVTNFEATEIISKFKAIRHFSQDIIIHCQSINPLRPIHYEAVSMIRVHHDRFDANRMEGKLAENYEVVKIAQLIVNEQYQKKFDYPEKSKEWHKYNSYHVYVDFTRKQIKGCTQEQFLAACKTYLQANKMVLKDLMQRIAHNNQRSKANFNDQLAAEQQWIEEKLKQRMLG